MTGAATPNGSSHPCNGSLATRFFHKAVGTAKEKEGPITDLLRQHPRAQAPDARNELRHPDNFKEAWEPAGNCLSTDN